MCFRKDLASKIISLKLYNVTGSKSRFGSFDNNKQNFDCIHSCKLFGITQFILKLDEVILLSFSHLKLSVRPLIAFYLLLSLLDRLDTDYFKTVL